MSTSRTKWLILTLLVILAGSLTLYQLRNKEIEVQVTPVQRGLVEKMVANTRAGTLKACRRANLSPGVGGQINALPVAKGERVRAGQLLLELWNRDLIAETTLAESEVKAADARVVATRLQAENARRQADRLQRLFHEGAVAAEAFDNANSEAEVLVANQAAAKAASQTSQARLVVLRAQLERTRLLAPFSGIIAEINGELNEYVTPSPPGIPTPPAVVLLDTSCFYVTAPIDEVDARGVAVGQQARISMDAFGSQRFAGRVRRIAPYVLDVEKQARTVDVEVEFTEHVDNKNLLAAYSADIEIIIETRPDTLRIPTQAVLEGNRVFVHEPDTGLLREKTITAGLVNWDQTEVLSGLREDEQIVTSIDRPGIKDGVAAKVSQKP